ncbi:hypothetical protein CFREI_11120 [Corynebacterium freiburgense]|nr:hypothetical protein CFREI_11120 [Corynebacterium freiburgense]
MRWWVVGDVKSAFVGWWGALDLPDFQVGGAEKPGFPGGLSWFPG